MNEAGNKKYDKNFYLKQKDYSYRSAKRILKVFFELYKPNSVVDLGCGLGCWLKVCEENGINKYFGYDINSMEEEDLFVSRDKIKVVDFNLQPEINAKVDLAICLEVAEHLKLETGEYLIKTLTQISDVVLFSAALPGQAGFEHINMHPLQYWVDLFAQYGYCCFDLIRKEVVYDDEVAPWYKQNILVFVSPDKSNLLEEKGYTKTKKPYMFYDNYFVEKLIDKLEKNQRRI